MPSLLKTAHIGLRHGHAKGLMATFKQLTGVKIVAYCEEMDPAALEPLKESDLGASCYYSVDEMIANEEFEVACLTLPCDELPAVGVKLARAGKHFLMDKQFARTAAEMRPLVETIQKQKVKVLAFYPWRRHPVIQGLKQLLDEGKLGRPLAFCAHLVTTQVRPGMRDPQGLAYRCDTEGGGILHMEGGHWLEALRFLMGCEVSAVTALCRPVVGHMAGENMDDVSMIGLEFENGAVGNLHMGYLQAVRSGKESGLWLWGSEGSAHWQPMGAPSLHVRSCAWEGNPERTLNFDLAKREGIYGGEQWLLDIVDDFMNAIRENQQPAVTALDGYRVLQVIDGSYEASRAGRRILMHYDI